MYGLTGARRMLAIAAIPAVIAAVGLIATAAVAGRSHEVLQKDKKFSVTELTIKQGESLVFRNDDPYSHNVYSTSPGIGFDLKVQKPGESSEVKFDRPGTGEVRCAIHPQMKLKLTVQ